MGLQHSVVDRHRFDTDPDPDFHFNAEPDTDPEWHQTDAGPHADPTLSCNFIHVRKNVLLFTAMLQCFSSLISGNGVILDIILKFCGKSI